MLGHDVQGLLQLGVLRREGVQGRGIAWPAWAATGAVLDQRDVVLDLQDAAGELDVVELKLALRDGQMVQPGVRVGVAYGVACLCWGEGGCGGSRGRGRRAARCGVVGGRD